MFAPPPYLTVNASAPYPMVGEPVYTVPPYDYAQQYGQPSGQHYYLDELHRKPRHARDGRRVIVGQPRRVTRVVTHPVERSPYVGCATSALVLSIVACLCTCWPIGLIAFILASECSILRSRVPSLCEEHSRRFLSFQASRSRGRNIQSRRETCQSRHSCSAASPSWWASSCSSGGSAFVTLNNYSDEEQDAGTGVDACLQLRVIYPRAD